MQYIKQQLADELNKVLNIKVEISLLTDPPQAHLGEFALPVFVYAKETKKNPAELTIELADKINTATSDMIESAAAVGPYLNLFLKPQMWNSAVIESIEKGNIEKGEKEKIMIEYSQPNTHKEFHVGHLRNACLGASLVNILRYQGQEVIASTYINDVGIHVARCLWNYYNHHKDDEVPEMKGEFLTSVYAEAVKIISDNEDLKSEVSQVLHAIENKEDWIYDLWLKTRDWSIDEFKVIYDILNIKFEEWFYESDIIDASKKKVDELLKQGIATKSEGAVIVDLKKYKLDVLLILKSDGNTLYSTSDLALAYKKFELGVDTSIYVVDNRQSLYFKQLFKTLKLVGFNKKMIHVAYDFVTTPEGSFSSREGNAVSFFELYYTVLGKLVEETGERHTDWSKKKIAEVAKKVSLAIIKFWMLKYENNSVIVFDMDKAMSVEGATGPYLLYTVARINSVLKKAGKNSSAVDYSLLKELEEKELIKIISRFNNVVKLAADKFQPSFLATYLLDLAQAANSFYHQHQVISDDTALQAVRVKLLQAVKTSMEKGLNLLNIDSVEEM